MANNKKKQLQKGVVKKNRKNFSKAYGKSSSIVGSIYTYRKRKKPKRLGKSCIYFDAEKLTCKLSKHLCRNVDECSSYIVNMQEILKEQSFTKKSHDIKEIGITAIVLNDNRKCTDSVHKVIDLNATLRIAKPDGKVINFSIPAAYCEKCDMYFVLKNDYKSAKARGTILCPVIDMTSYNKNQKNTRPLSSSESRIHQLGYNVKRGNGYTKEQRQLILANILENTNISRHEIESCILRPMSQHKNQNNYADAVLAWQQDLDFINNYKCGDIPEVIIDKIIVGKRQKNK